MKQMENWQPGQKQRDVRPDWLTTVIEETAELFEPLTGVARVGFDCQLEEDTWVVRMYLGTSEIVGGPFDGQMRPMSFEIDLQRLFARFKDISPSAEKSTATPSEFICLPRHRKRPAPECESFQTGVSSPHSRTLARQPATRRATNATLRVCSSPVPSLPPEKARQDDGPFCFLCA
ncbi:MAG: hypothetical protein ACYTGL_10435 [Planctomycetota bacterium]|jgi:hypothetical protein